MRNTRKPLIMLLTYFTLQLSMSAQIHPPDTTSNSAFFAFEHGITQFKNSEWANAIDWWRKAIAIDPQMKGAWYNSALAYYYMEDFLETEKHLEKVLTIDPFDSEAYGLLGLALYKRGDFRRAIKALNFAIEKNPSIELRLTKSICHIADGSPKYALPELDEILHDDPGHTRACIIKGVALMNLGQYNYAIRFLNRVLDFDPNNVEALTNRAICHFYQGTKEDAYADFEIVLTTQPTIAALLARGKCFLADGQFQKAKEDVKKALSIDPRNPSIYYLMGEIEFSLSQYPKAIESFMIAYDLDHTCMDCLLLKIEAQTHLSQFEEAIKDAYEILSNEPNNERARSLLIWIYAQIDMKNDVERSLLRS